MPLVFKDHVMIGCSNSNRADILAPNKMKGEIQNIRVVLSVVMLLFTVGSYAKPNMDATIATNHLWRGGEVASGLVVTSSLSISDPKEHFTAGFWGGMNTEGEYKEFNNFVSYRYERLSFELWDTYNFSTFATYNNEEFFNYDPATTGRFLDATLRYRCPDKFPILLSWSTVLFGRDRNSDNTENRYSTFCYVEYPLYNKNEWSAEGGLGAAFAINPEPSGANFYGTKSGIVHITLKVTNRVQIRNYTLPISVLTMWNPQSDKAYFQLAAQLFSF